MAMEEDTAIDFGYTYECFNHPGVKTCAQFDHAYSTPKTKFSEKGFPEKTARYLFTTKESSSDYVAEDDIVDVENVDEEVTILRGHFGEDREESSPYFTPHDEKDWHEKPDKKGWSPTKLHLLKSVVNILEADRLSRLSIVGVKNSLVKGRLVTNKLALRLRRIFSSVCWNNTLLHWLHGLLADNLPKDYLASYQEALQCLETKVPSHLVENIISLGRIRQVGDNPSNKKNWDPYVSALTKVKLDHLPGSPYIVFVPFIHNPNLSLDSRPKKLMSELSHLSTLIAVPYPKSNTQPSNIEVRDLLDQIMRLTSRKVAELNADFPTKPVILVGFDAGSAIACQVALVEKVHAVVCLGFHLFTTEGRRGTFNDKLLNLKVPTVFVIGQNAVTATAEGIQELQLHLECRSHLIVVGGGDDQFRLSHHMRMRECITQSMADRMILNEVGSFLNEVLSSQKNQPSNTVATSPSSDKQKLREKTTDVVDKNQNAKKPRMIMPKKVTVDPINRETYIVGKGPQVTDTATSVFGSSPKTDLQSQEQISVSFQTSGVMQSLKNSSLPSDKTSAPKPPLQNTTVFTHMEFEESPNESVQELKRLTTTNFPLSIGNGMFSHISSSGGNNSLALNISETKVPKATMRHHSYATPSSSIRPKRPYVRRVPLEKRKPRPVKISSLSAISSQIANIKTDISVQVSTTDSTPLTSVTDLTPNSILNLPVVFTDSSTNTDPTI